MSDTDKEGVKFNPEPVEFVAGQEVLHMSITDTGITHISVGGVPVGILQCFCAKHCCFSSMPYVLMRVCTYNQASKDRVAAMPKISWLKVEIFELSSDLSAAEAEEFNKWSGDPNHVADERLLHITHG